ncbi:MAG: 1-deoxy-D-xylulose-5-phosphate synthase [Clostridia bacterium]|nr:1-deoxy-D-xylulose-5-phosphate synthase [Clostridia bacterium]
MLDNVNDLEDFKSLPVKDLPRLASEIREFLIQKVSKTGGHLAPNLGVVELTMALHYVFNSPSDKIIFDVGHQCYVHKILTGRKDKFDTLRKLNGLSGFPKTRESIHDIFDTGHSSTSISSAIGIATANKLSGKDDYTIAVIGDGALTGGLAFEGLNNAQIDDTNLIVILNDNQMSISPSIGNVANYLTKLRSNKFYRNTKKTLKIILLSIPFLGKYIYKILDKIKDILKHIIFPNSVLFEQFGFSYLGPIDGHDIRELIRILDKAKIAKKPVLIHVLTKKGKGYEPAENDPNKFHGISQFDIETGEAISSSSGSFSKTFGDELYHLAEKNDKIVAITAAMASGTGLSSFSKRFPTRFYDVGIAESHAVTFAAGLARGGYIPVFAVYSTFLQRAYDQIIHDVALQNLHVIFAIDRAGIVGADGETHHGIFDLSYLSHIPNMTIMAPKDGNELKQMLQLAIKINGPVAIRYPRGNYSDELMLSKDNQEQSISNHQLIVGKAEILQEGKDLSIIAYGKTVRTAIEVANILKEKNIFCEIINTRFLKPLDKETIFNSIKKTRRFITIEDNVISGGLASLVQNLMVNEQNVTGKYFAYPDEFIKHGSCEELEKLYGMDAKTIANWVMRIVDGSEVESLEKS